jgi:hypothetical protein
MIGWPTRADAIRSSDIYPLKTHIRCTLMELVRLQFQPLQQRLMVVRVGVFGGWKSSADASPSE